LAGEHFGFGVLSFRLGQRIDDMDDLPIEDRATANRTAEGDVLNPAGDAPGGGRQPQAIVFKQADDGIISPTHALGPLG
jgi:hypothetical protein